MHTLKTIYCDSQNDINNYLPHNNDCLYGTAIYIAVISALSSKPLTKRTACKASNQQHMDQQQNNNKAHSFPCVSHHCCCKYFYAQRKVHYQPLLLFVLNASEKQQQATNGIVISEIPT